MRCLEFRLERAETFDLEDTLDRAATLDREDKLERAAISALPPSFSSEFIQASMGIADAVIVPEPDISLKPPITHSSA